MSQLRHEQGEGRGRVAGGAQGGGEQVAAGQEGAEWSVRARVCVRRSGSGGCKLQCVRRTVLGGGGSLPSDARYAAASAAHSRRHASACCATSHGSISSSSSPSSAAALGGAPLRLWAAASALTSRSLWRTGWWLVSQLAGECTSTSTCSAHAVHTPQGLTWRTVLGSDGWPYRAASCSHEV